MAIVIHFKERPDIIDRRFEDVQHAEYFEKRKFYLTPDSRELINIDEITSIGNYIT